jgi:hypothetical protein
MAKVRQDVRCNDCRFNTLLFRFSLEGIWVFCRDCRTDGKRGKEHLITWRRLFYMWLTADAVVHNDQPSKSAAADTESSKS